MRFFTVMLSILLWAGLTAAADAKVYEGMQNYGTGYNKSGGRYLSIPAGEILAPGNKVSFRMKSGSFSYIFIHARYEGGIWKSLMQVTSPDQVIDGDTLISEVNKLRRGSPTHIIFSINGQHEGYLPMAAQADIIVSNGDEDFGMTDGKVYEGMQNFGTGNGKAGGKYIAIASSEILVPNGTVSFRMKSGSFSYIFLHARYDGGIWKTLMKVSEENATIDTDQIIYAVKKLSGQKPTHIIFSINGQHERYMKLAAEADIIVSTSGAAQESGIKINRAVYGKGNRVCDATAAVQSMCVGKKDCTVAASNGLCGDPYYGTVKELNIEYECDGRKMQRTIVENTQDTLSCSDADSASDMKVISAAYGKYGRFCDYTYQMKSVCDGKAVCSVRADNSLCGDPNGGTQELFITQYSCRGQVKYYAVSEGEYLSLECR